jgi:hypothetical protein
MPLVMMALDSATDTSTASIAGAVYFASRVSASRRSWSMLAHGSAAEPDANGRGWMIETGVVEPCRDHVLGALAGGHTLREETAHQEPRDRGISVRKMERVRGAVGVARGCASHVRCRTGLKIEALEAEKPNGQTSSAETASMPTPHPRWVLV